jgi:hypothetical protein
MDKVKDYGRGFIVTESSTKEVQWLIDLHLQLQFTRISTSLSYNFGIDRDFS